LPPDRRLKNPSPEVIEFPAVLFDANAGSVPDDPLAVFHEYVMPTEEPVLSKFCTELTGIRQEQVDAGSVPEGHS
jgi:ERI1 exoribonuclease 2